MNQDADETLDSQQLPRGDQSDSNETQANAHSVDSSFELADQLEPGEIETSQDFDATRESFAKPRALGASKEATNGSQDIDFSVHQPSPVRATTETATASFTSAVTHIGRYETIRVLGEGAFGYVFEANDPQLDRKVAIKVAKSISSSNAIERFLREARSAAQLRHPNIIPVHEYGQVDDKHIIVYEYIEGETLKSYISRNKPLELSETLRLVRQIAEGLDYAHSKGIIHRDMKPDNVMIDSSGQPHIADFGCARSMEADVSLTMDGSILGTPTYMSPEQASGRSNTADGRTDIWSLGVMLYEMIADKKPFSGKLTDLLFWIRNHDPPPLRKANPAAPIDIETICKKCLQRELPDRFATARELADEIERFERGEPIQSRPVTLLRRVALWRKRNPAVANLLGAVALSLAAGITFSSYYAWEAWRERSERIETQLKGLGTARPSEVPALLTSMRPGKSEFLPRLHERLDAPDTTDHMKKRVQTALLYLENESDVRARISKELTSKLLTSEPELVLVAREAIVDQAQQITNQLWPIALNENGKSSAQHRLRAACLLSKLDPGSANWEAIAGDLSGILVNINLLESTKWLPALTPLRNQLRTPLETSFHRDRREADQANRAATLLANLFEDQIDVLTHLTTSSTPEQLSRLLPSLQATPDVSRDHLARQLEALDGVDETESIVISKANLIITLIQLGSKDCWEFLDRQKHVSVAAEIIERLGPSAGLNASLVDEVIGQLIRWQSFEPNSLASLILSFGQFSNAQIPPSLQADLKPTLFKVFSEHPDAGVHASARWLLQQWGAQPAISATELELRSSQPRSGFRWHVDLDGNTFAIFDPVDQFTMGISGQRYDGLTDREIASGGEQQHLRRIPRRFGICMHEVTSDQYARFESYLVERWKQKLATLESDDEKFARQLTAWIKDIPRQQSRRADHSPDGPIVEVDYFHALAYCRWLSDQHSTGYCLPTVSMLHRMYHDKIDQLPLLSKHIQRPGYRLPTAAEWEYACKANSMTLRPSGVIPTRMGNYAWFGVSGDDPPKPVGLLKPSAFGLFDILGNASEWCLTWHREERPDESFALSSDLVANENSDPIWPDIGNTTNGWQSNFREFRGGSYRDLADALRSTKRFCERPFKAHRYLGFRLARTYKFAEEAE